MYFCRVSDNTDIEGGGCDDDDDDVDVVNADDVHVTVCEKTVRMGWRACVFHVSVVILMVVVVI